MGGMRGPARSISQRPVYCPSREGLNLHLRRAVVSKKVFISYRREDTADAAGRVYDRLWRVLSKPNVFFDVSTIGGGENFKEKIVSAIGRSDAALIFIGREWLAPVEPAAKLVSGKQATTCGLSWVPH